MIAITSIAPNHVSDQQKAIKSWLDAGIKVYSFNSHKEAELLFKDYKDVHFVETYRTLEHIYGKPVVSISAMIDWCKMSFYDKFIFVNSDIEIDNDSKILTRISKELDKNLVLANRLEYSEKNPKDKTAKYYYDGIDVFCLNKIHLHVYNQSMFAMGQCFWDYWIPFTAQKSGFDVTLLRNHKAFYHKEHPLQYSTDNWHKTGRYFRIDNSLYQFEDTTRGIGDMSKFVFNNIYRQMIKKEL